MNKNTTVSADARRRCADCSEPLSPGDQFAVIGDQDGIYCEECANYYAHCDRCTSPMHWYCIGHVSPTPQEEPSLRYCPFCVNEECFACISSGCAAYDRKPRYLRNSAIGLRGERGSLCTAHATGWFKCIACNDLFRSTSEFLSTTRANTCTNCHDEHGLSRGIWSDTAPRLIFYGADGDTHYGIELEVDLRGRTDKFDAAKLVRSSLGKRHVYVKPDGSINNGFEIVTHPHTPEAHKEIFTDRFFSLSNILDGTRNGMHVHVERKNLTKPQHIEKVVAFINATPNRAFVTDMAGRGPTSWARYDGDKVVGNCGQYERYEAVNRYPIKTIEFRIFRATMDKSEFLSNLEFSQAVVEFCGLVGVSELTVHKFCHWVAESRSRFPYLLAEILEKRYIALPGQITANSLMPTTAAMQAMSAA